MGFICLIWQDIVRGDPSFYLVFLEEHFQSVIERMVSEVSVFLKNPLPVSFDFSDAEDFDEREEKMYRIKPTLQAYQAVALMCRKYDVSNPRYRWHFKLILEPIVQKQWVAISFLIIMELNFIDLITSFGVFWFWYLLLYLGFENKEERNNRN